MSITIKTARKCILFAEFHILYYNLLFLYKEGSVSTKADNCPNERVYSLLFFL